MSKWKLKSDTVTVGENSQQVRQLTASEQDKFAATSAKIKAGEMQANELPSMLCGFACLGLSKDDVDGMPPELRDACVTRILELSGIKTADEGEKKA